MGAQRFAITISAVAAALLAACLPATADYQTHSVGIGDRENMVYISLKPGTDPGADIALPTYPQSTHVELPPSDPMVVSDMYLSEDSLDAVSAWFKHRLPVSWTSSYVTGAARTTIAYRWSGRSGSQAILIQQSAGQTMIVEATGRFDTAFAASASSVGRVIEIPKYPGAEIRKLSPPSPMEIKTGGSRAGYKTTASADDVVAWYRAHLPAYFGLSSYATGPTTMRRYFWTGDAGYQSIMILPSGSGCWISINTVDHAAALRAQSVKR